MAVQGLREKTQFGNLLASLRRKKGMTVKELANKVGVSAAAITQWEHGKRKPKDVGVILRILTVLEASDEERREILDSRGYQEPLTQDFLTQDLQDLDELELLKLVDGKFERIANLRAETTDQIEELKRLFQQQLLTDAMTLEQLKESADCRMQESRYAAAAERYDQACSLAIRTGESKYELAGLYAKAIWPNYVINEVEKCISLAKEVIRLYEEEEIADSSLPLAEAYRWLSVLHERFGEYELAQQYADEAIKAGIALVDMVSNMADIKTGLGQWQEAEELFKQAVELSKKEGRGLASALNGLAWLYIKQERLVEAKDYCFRSLQLRDEAPEEGVSRSTAGATRGTAICHSYLADIYINQAEWNFAEMHLITAIELFSQVGDERNLAEQYYDWAIIALERDHNPELALRYAERFVEVFKDIPFKREQAMGKRLMAKVYAESGTREGLAQAQELSRESIEVLRSIGDKRELGLSCYEMGRINKKLGHEQAARDCLIEAKVIFEDLRLPGKIKKVEELLHPNDALNLSAAH